MSETITETIAETIATDTEILEQIANSATTTEQIMYYILGILLIIFVYGAFKALYRLFNMFFG